MKPPTFAFVGVGKGMAEQLNNTEGTTMAAATWVTHELEEQGVHFEETHHPDAFTAQAVAQREHFSGHCVAKVVVVMARGRPVELVLPASRRVALEQVKELLGTDDVRLANEKEMDRHFADCERGAIPPLRHWSNVEVLLDGWLCTDGEILFQAGTHRDGIRMRFDDWFRLVNPRVEMFTEPAGNVPRKYVRDFGGEAAEL